MRLKGIERKTSLDLQETILLLRYAHKKTGARIRRAVADELERPRRNMRAVNVSRINRYTKPGDVVVVPGKVLGMGTLDHPVTVAAFKFSKRAKEIIEKAGGEAITIKELIRRNPKGSNVKIIG